MTDERPQSETTFGFYLDSVATRLGERGYEDRLDGPAGYQTMTFHDRRFSLTKFDLVDYFVVVGRFESLDSGTAAAFSEAVFEYGLTNKSMLQRGAGGNLVVFPVLAVDDSLGPQILDWVESYSPKH